MKFINEMEDKIIDLLSSEDLNLRSLGKNILIQNYKIPKYLYTASFPSFHFYLERNDRSYLAKMASSRILLFMEKMHLYTDSEIRSFLECIYEYNK